MRTRAWSSNWDCIYDSDTDPRSLEEFMDDSGEGQRISVHDGDYCWSGYAYRAEDSTMQFLNSDWLKDLINWRYPAAAAE